VLRKASVLPITFRSGGGGGDSIGGGVTGVTGDVGGCGGVTGGTGGSTGSRVIGVAGGKCGGARLTHRYLAAHPGTPCFEGFARSVILRVLLLEVREHVLGAVGGPEHQ
jgi:hypothetical protein